MLCRTHNPDKIIAMASILILGGVIPLAGALVSQYGFGFHPCHFCLLQRYPYLVVIAAGVLSKWIVTVREAVPPVESVAVMVT